MCKTRNSRVVYWFLLVILGITKVHSFTLHEDATISQECLDQLKVVDKTPSLLWRMFDASSKYPISGLAFGVDKDFGNFEECMSIDHEESDVDRIKGKYCAFSVAFINPLLNSSGYPDSNSIRSVRVNDGLGTPKILSPEEYKKVVENDTFITFLSVCIPNKCTPAETIGHFLPNSIPIPISFAPEGVAPPCRTVDTDSDYTWGDITFITFLSLVLLLMVASTIYDIVLHKHERKTKHPLYIAFSVLTNGKKLFAISTTRNPEQIPCLDGLRFISMMWIVAGHGGATFKMFPIVNKEEFARTMDHWTFQYLQSAPIAVDTFFFLSGLLLAYGYMKISVNKKPRQLLAVVPPMMLHRYLRLTPPVAVLFFGSITIFNKLGNGPLYGKITEAFNTQCREHWWSFFLYIQNYVNYDQICLNHTWYLSADMQMFILSPLILIPAALMVKKNLKLVMYCLGALTVICVIFPMVIRFLDHSITNLYDTHGRFNDFLIGIMLGIWIRLARDKPFYFSRLMNVIIWIVVLLVDIAFNVYYSRRISQDEHTQSTLFDGLYRPIWCTSLAWMVYSCYHGYGGFINWILTRPIFQIGGRLSYCMYLTHAVIQGYYLGILRHIDYFSHYHLFYIFCGHFIVTIIVSIIWTLSFEAPMIIIEKVIFQGTPRKPAVKQSQPA